MTATKITREQFHATLRYEPDTGKIIRFGWLRKGVFLPYEQPRVVDGTNSLGYVQVRVGGETFLGHRLAWFLTQGEWPEVIDHINGDRADNRLCNLRNVSQAVNTQNLRECRSHSTTGFLGVSYEKARKKFVAAVGLNGKRLVIGRFDTPEAAHEAYLERKRTLHEGSTL